MHERNSRERARESETETDIQVERKERAWNITCTVTFGLCGMVTSQNTRAPMKNTMMVKAMAIKKMQQRERLFFFSVSVPSSSKIVPGAQALLYPFFWAGPPPVPAWGSTLREPGLGAVAMLKDVEPELPFLKCLCIGDAIGLSRGVAREKLCENESTSCVVDSRDGDCTKYTGCPCLVGDNGGDGTKLDSESNDALIFPYRDILLLRTYTEKKERTRKPPSTMSSLHSAGCCFCW